MGEERNIFANSGLDVAVRREDLPNVARRLDGLDDSIQRLDHQLAQLFNKLAPALGPGRSEKSPVDGVDWPAQSELAARLHGATDKLSEMINAVANTIDCLEL